MYTIIKKSHVFHENKLVTDFKEKAEIFNSYFAKQCSLINSDSSLPYEIIKKTNNALYSTIFSTEDILQIINNLNFGSQGSWSR